MDIFIQFCQLEFDKEAISDGFMTNSRVFRGGRGGLIYLRELRFCGPLRPFFLKVECVLYNITKTATKMYLFTYLCKQLYN